MTTGYCYSHNWDGGGGCGGGGRGGLRCGGGGDGKGGLEDSLITVTLAGKVTCLS